MDDELRVRIEALELLLKRSLYIEEQLRPEFGERLHGLLRRDRADAENLRDGISEPSLGVIEQAEELLDDSLADPG